MKSLKICSLVIFCLLFSCAKSFSEERPDYLSDNFHAKFEKKLEEQGSSIPDPLYPINKAFFNFNNEFFYPWVADPVTDAYQAIICEPVRESIDKFLYNIEAPLRFLGSLAQLKLGNSLFEMGRFMINTSFGVGGFFEPMKEKALDDEDLGQALGYWGVGEGFYLVIPAFGPTNLRDGLAGGAYFLIEPTSNLSDKSRAGFESIDSTNRWGKSRGIYKERLKEINPYTSIRNIYIQNRREAIRK